MKCIFAYTPHVIMPPYINISQYEGALGGHYLITVRSFGNRITSVIDIPREQLKALAESILKHLGEIK